MKNKGFTLVEVMAVVIIIASIALVSFPVLTSVMKNNAKLEEDTFKENAIEAAKTYFNLNKDKFVFDEEGYANVEVEELVETDMLDKPNFKYKYNNKMVRCDKDYNCKYIIKYKTYTIGEEITIDKNSESVKYHVIGSGDDYLTLLKDEPLTVDEINTYGGVGTENNHVNMYAASSRSSYYYQAYDRGDTNHTGGMAYYTSETCGYNGSSWIYSGCTTDYNDSDVKYVVDGWTKANFTSDELKKVDGYRSRLAQKEELRLIGWPTCSSTARYCYKESTTPNWIFPNYGHYWTMSQCTDGYSDDHLVYTVTHYGAVGLDGAYGYVHYTSGMVRPVINVYKSVLENN